jgi:putative flippase GtrA
LKQFQRFLLVGALGFLVDFAVLYMMVNLAGLGPLAGRLLSFLIAASVTWKANRHFTFVASKENARKQWLRYLMTTAIGGVVNIGIYRLWLTFSSNDNVNLFLAVTAGSAVALFVNFTLSKYVVFSR